ncbi:hypothetical protein LBMAG36_03050 [Chlorobiota bacterium]|nr:hypothetical protein LBMAG36_03050 [Chlorobiota bacterium]
MKCEKGFILNNKNPANISESKQHVFQEYNAVVDPNPITWANKELKVTISVFTGGYTILNSLNAINWYKES